MQIYVKIYFISIFYIFLVLNSDFVICRLLIFHIAGSNTETDDVTD